MSAVPDALETAITSTVLSWGGLAYYEKAADSYVLIANGGEVLFEAPLDELSLMAVAVESRA